MNCLKDKSNFEKYKMVMQSQFEELRTHIVTVTMLADASEDYCTQNSDFDAADYLNIISLSIYDMYECAKNFEGLFNTEFERFNKEE